MRTSMFRRMEKKYQIIIWGAGNTARHTLKHMDGRAEVLGFLDNNSDIREFEGLEALEKEQLRTIGYDYVVICSVSCREIYRQLTDMGVGKEKILVDPVFKAEQYRLYKANFFRKKWKDLLAREKPEIFISGISYHNDGIDGQVFFSEVGKTAFNFANRGQDIFYDYQIAKLLDRNRLLEKVTHYIMGLCYYSFEYDFSKSVNSWEIIRYYPYIQEQHNLASACPFEEFVHTVREYLEGNKACYELFNNEIKFTVNYEEGARTAEMDFNKNYPVTVWENKRIFRQFLNFIKGKGIKPVIVIMPATEGYVQHCPKEFKEGFYDALSECMEGSAVQVLDYFGNYYGDISDYYHVTHFNAGGAKKFTEKLIKDIVW